MLTKGLRLLLLDDHALFRESLARLLGAEPGIAMVSQAASIDEAIKIIALEAVDLVLLDYDLGNEAGTELLGRLRANQTAPRILIVTAGMTETAMNQATRDGVNKIFLKHLGPQNLIQAISDSMEVESTTAAIGSFRECPAFNERSEARTSRDRPLTHRQRKVLHKLLDGFTNREIATQVNMSESSIKAVIQELFEKAAVRTRSQLVRIALEKHADDWLRS